MFLPVPHARSRPATHIGEAWRPEVSRTPPCPDVRTPAHVAWPTRTGLAARDPEPAADPARRAVPACAPCHDQVVTLSDPARLCNGLTLLAHGVPSGRPGPDSRTPPPWR